MTSINEKTPAAGQGSESEEQILKNNSVDHSTLTASRTKRRRKRPAIRHYIINGAEIKAGTASVYRALCGHTFSVRWGIPARTASLQEQATWEHCTDCASMEQHMDGLRDDWELGL